jgi:hypothetical protein
MPVCSGMDKAFTEDGINRHCRKSNNTVREHVKVKMFQQDDTFSTVFYSLQTALHVSGETFTRHQELE